ncbi:hypothetical protein Rhopal_002090-T1 [Rhodotorula paludigena]|uniref:F-box domain-containing protein n=1 Tax=Rhodotorula paludigena TaxID=86838 RepID=A0AAV5G949_9BASI|nr:hypothetical protein Rhopal_002090-T1 [Rhodotorula paludigena]
MAALLDLPDELLVLIIDQALGAFLPARYKSRQQTACALSLVSRRFGGLARPKVLEVITSLHIRVRCELSVSIARTFPTTLDELVLLVRACGGLNHRSDTSCPPLLVDVILGVLTPSLLRVDKLEPYRHSLAAGELPNLALLYIPSFDDFPPDAFTDELAALHTACDARGVEVVVDPECCDSERGEVFSAHFRAYRRRMRAAEKVASDQKDEEL